MGSNHTWTKVPPDYMLSFQQSSILMGSSDSIATQHLRLKLHVTRKGLEPFAELGRFPVRQTLVGWWRFAPTQNRSYVSFLLFLVLHRCKFFLAYTTIHGLSEILMVVTVLSESNNCSCPTRVRTSTLLDQNQTCCQLHHRTI